MSRIFCIVGKSGSGKDTFYKAVLEKYRDKLTPIIPCTTRPMREGEVSGENYFFVTDAELRRLERQGKIIEKREYHTVQGLWTYFTPKFELENERDYILITTLEGVRSFIDAFGEAVVRPVYLTLPDGKRLHRCLDREDAQPRPDYAEMCRRYLADEADFSLDKLSAIPGLQTVSTEGSVEESVEEWEKILAADPRRTRSDTEI